ncbi:MAG: hypothetical protein ACYCSJ_12570 [Acidimicrobiales bacterium]
MTDGEWTEGEDPVGAPEPRPGRLGRLRRDMTQNEQLAVYGGAVFALGITIYFLLVPAAQTHSGKATATTHVSAALTLTIGLAVFVLLAGAARVGRRTVAAVISLLAAFGMGQILGFIYIALGAWLLFRSSKATRLRLAAERGTGTTGAGGSRPARAPRPARGARGARGRQPEPAPKRRTPSKRYTPPAAKGRKR